MLRRITLLLVNLALPVYAQDTAGIDKAVNDILAKTGAPSASVAVVRNGQIAYAHAYGTANLETKMPATSQMRYSIGSISKQFTSSAVLMLAEEGKLSLDDKVVRWLPELTRAGDVTIRQLLSMTSGYQDYFPGSKSSGLRVIAGMIVEKAAGMPLLELLQKRVFGPLQMMSVSDIDSAPLGSADPARYLRYALGPLRPAPKEGKGWLFAAGELAMTATNLAKWDISMIDRAVLKPASYREMQNEVKLANGVGSRYGLGVSLSLVDGRRVVSHGGEVSGFTAQNVVYPDDRAAIVVLTNLDATSAAPQIADRIASILFAPAGTDDSAKKIFMGLQKGQIDRSLFTSNANAYFSDQALKDFASSLGPLGTPQGFTQTREGLRGGMTLHSYRVVFPKKTLRVWTFTMPDGKLEQFMVAAAE